MQALLPIAVFLLMISIGMSLRPSNLLQHWRRLIAGNGFRLVVATFLIPPAVALLLYHLRCRWILAKELVCSCWE